MLKELKKIIKNSESELTNFRVASIIIDANGNKYPGVNVEYAVVNNGICAERNAISSAYTDGMKKGELREVHILGEKKTNPDIDLFISPCGLCRQAIYESSNGNAKIFLYNLNGKISELSIKELLPLAFSGEEI